MSKPRDGDKKYCVTEHMYRCAFVGLSRKCTMVFNARTWKTQTAVCFGKQKFKKTRFMGHWIDICAMLMCVSWASLHFVRTVLN